MNTDEPFAVHGNFPNSRLKRVSNVFKREASDERSQQEKVRLKRVGFPLFSSRNKFLDASMRNELVWFPS